MSAEADRQSFFKGRQLPGSRCGKAEASSAFAGFATFYISREKKMLRNLLAACCAASLLISGCSTIKISERNTSIVLAKDAKKGEGPSGIADTFPLEGKIVAYMTFGWDDTNARGDSQKVEVKWFSGDRLVSAPSNSFDFGRPPHYVWFTTYGTALGIGKARVEVYVDGVFAGSKTFEIVGKI